MLAKVVRIIMKIKVMSILISVIDSVIIYFNINQKILG